MCSDNMRKFTEEDYNSLTPFEDKMKSAMNSRYVTGITQECKEVFSKVYKEVFGRQANVSCSGCLLQMLTMIGRTYFDFKEELNKNNKNNAKTKRNKKTVQEEPGTDDSSKSDNINL